MKWVFRNKVSNGKTVYKARLVARGYKDDSIYKVSEIYAPTATVSVIRALISLAVNKKWPLRHFDISNAFLNGEVSREIDVKPPEGMSESHNIVYKLNWSLYSLKSTPKSWNDMLHKVLLKGGLKRAKSDLCLYVFGGNDPQSYIVIVYVDDLLITGNESAEIGNLHKMLSTEFKVKDLGEVTKFIGLEVERDYVSNTLYLSQSNYISEVLDMYGLENCNPVKVPMDPGIRIESKEPNPVYVTKVRELIGALSYIARGSRPDINFAVNLLSRYQNVANEKIFKAIEYLCRRGLCWRSN